MTEYVNMWKNYFNFFDHTTVRGYWMATLFNVIISFALGFVLGLLRLTALASIYSLAIFIPGLALSIRRLRDGGKAWYWIFITLVPLVGWIIMLIFLCQPSLPDDGTPVV